MDNLESLEDQISKLRTMIDALGGQIPNLPYGSKERVEKEALQQRMMSNLNKLENDSRRKV
jgi:hypothetical protein